MRRLTAVTGAFALTATALIVGAPQASAASQTITGASFEWSLSDYFQFSVAGLQGGAPCPTLSAGYLETTNPGNGTGQLGTGATFKSSEGNVTILKDGVEPTFANQCTGAVAAAPGAAPLNKKVVWSGGTGTRDSATGAATVNFTGMLSLKLSGAPARIVDPELTVNPDGTGALKATSVISGHSPSDSSLKTTSDVTIAELSGIDVDALTGFVSAPPAFEGNAVTIGASTFPAATVQAAYTGAGLAPTASVGWITQGAPVASGFGDPMGDGLSESAPLATIPGGTTGTGESSANLEMRVPVDPEAGSYQATLTLTGLG